MQSLYYLAVIGLSALGLVKFGYFYAFHMLHIIVDNDILMRVIRVRSLLFSKSEFMTRQRFLSYSL